MFLNKTPPQPISPLLTLLFGADPSHVAAVSPRLALWAAAFDAWLASLDSPNKRRQACRAWESFLHFHHCLPWDVDRSKIQAWTLHLAQSGRTPNTIRCYQGRISGFIRFCAKNPHLLASEPTLPAVRAASKPQPHNYQNAYVLLPSEARALLRAVDRQASLIAKRDYASLLAALLTGLPEARLRGLRWHDVAPLASPAAPPPPGAVQLPPAACDAIHHYLAASGRLAAIQPDHFIFAPLADPLLRPPTGDPSEWSSHRPLSREQIYVFIKAYAAWAGLDSAKVTYACLRHTAAALHLQSGADAAGVQAFLGRRYLKETQCYLSHLGRMLAARKPRPPRLDALRRPRRPFKRKQPYAPLGNQNAIRHGLFSHAPIQVTPQDIADSDQATIDSEIVLLRVSLRSALQRIEKIRNFSDSMRALNVVGLTTVRIARLLRTRQELQGAPFHSELQTLLEQVSLELDDRQSGK
jgi:integrase